MQKLVRAAREGTKDGLEKTKAAVKRGRSFIRTKSFISAGAFPYWVPSGWARGGGTLSPQQKVGAFSQMVDFATSQLAPPSSRVMGIPHSRSRSPWVLSMVIHHRT